MKILVTGGCGYIGSHLVRILSAAKRNTVIVLDKVSRLSGQSPEEAKHNVHIVQHTLGSTDDSNLDACLNNVDVVYHLAAEKHNQNRNDPDKIIKTNINGTYALLSACQRAKVKKVIFSSSLYAGGRTQAPQMLESDPAYPTTLYGISKLAGEQMVALFAAKSGFRYVNLRLYFVYGPGQYPGTGYKSVIMKNFDRIQRNEPPVIFGDGTQTLDYVYIDDAIRILGAAMDNGILDGTVNVCSGVPLSVNELTERMLEVSESRLKPVYLPPDDTQSTYRVGNPVKFKRIFNNPPMTPLTVGLRNVWNCFNNTSV